MLFHQPRKAQCHQQCAGAGCWCLESGCQSKCRWSAEDEDHGAAAEHQFAESRRSLRSFHVDLACAHLSYAYWGTTTKVAGRLDLTLSLCH